MAIRRFKSRATAGRLLKSGTLAQLTDLADIRVTKFRGDGDAGTLQGIIDSAGAVTTVGCLVLQTRYASGTVSSAGAYNATGVIYGAGSYATEASRNSATAGASQILTGYSVTLLGSTTNGSATAEAHTANQVLKSAGGNYNDDNLSVGNVRPVAFGLAATGTLANLVATDSAYVTLENSRNNDNGTVAADLVSGKSVKIRNSTTNGSLDMSLWTLITGVAIAGDVRVGVDRYTGGPPGTLQGIIDSAGVVTTVGCLVSGTRYATGTVSAAGAYNATGVIYGAGSYATEASRNSATAGAGQILTGYSITLLGSTTNGSYTPGGPGYTYGDNDASQVLTTADGPGTYHAPEASEVIFGANVGTTTGTFFGVCSSTGVTAASGIIDWIGDKFSTGILASGGLHYASVGLTNGQVQNGVNYKDESGLHLGSYDPITGNYTDPGKAFVLIGNNYYFAGVLQVAAYAGGGGYVFGDNNASFVLTTAIGPGDYVPIADSDTVDGGVSFGDGEVGTGVNATTAQAAAAAALAAYGASILTAQNVRDSMKLAPTAGAPEAGSVDKHLDDVVGGAPVSLTTETTIIESD